MQNPLLYPTVQVLEFMNAAGQLEDPNLPTLYTKLVAEEFGELADAIEADDEVETLDAILDIIWVLLGLGIAMKLPMPAGWDEVARSNFAKIDPVTGKVEKNNNGKVKKPEGWTPPNLKALIELRNANRKDRPIA
jgi:predicted HAD superfamily Cof-like phosphohydrolase